MLLCSCVSALGASTQPLHVCSQRGEFVVLLLLVWATFMFTDCILKLLFYSEDVGTSLELLQSENSSLWYF